MTQIDFYTNTADRLATACRLTQKAYSLGHNVYVMCIDGDAAERVDRMLWLAPATGFVPHCASNNPLAAVTPVVIDADGATPPHDQVLINLTNDAPPLFARFERLIEIVGGSEDERQLARSRYKFYRDRGYAIRIHDLAQTASAQT